MSAHMMLSIEAMNQNSIQYHAPADDPDSFITLTAEFTMLSGLMSLDMYNLSFITLYLAMDFVNDSFNLHMLV